MGVPILGISGLPFRSPRTKWHLGVGPVGNHKVYYKGGRRWLPPSSGCGESCESMFARGSSVHQKCSSYALTNLLFSLCRFAGVIDLLVTLPTPISELQRAPLPLKCYELGSTPQVLFLPLSSSLDSYLSLSKNLGVHQLGATKMVCHTPFFLL
jgi:hypothetical protein